MTYEGWAAVDCPNCFGCSEDDIRLVFRFIAVLPRRTNKASFKLGSQSPLPRAGLSIYAYAPSPEGTKRCSHGREPMDSVARTTGEPRRGERGSECPSSFRPFGTSRCVLDVPWAYAHGYNLSPLRGYVRAPETPFGSGWQASSTGASNMKVHR